MRRQHDFFGFGLPLVEESGASFVNQSQSEVMQNSIAHFTVVCLVTWPWIGSEAGGDLVLIQTSMLFICK